MHAFKTILLPIVMASLAIAVPTRQKHSTNHDLPSETVPSEGAPCGPNTAVRFNCGDELVCHVPDKKTHLQPTCTSWPKCCAAWRKDNFMESTADGIVRSPLHADARFDCCYSFDDKIDLGTERCTPSVFDASFDTSSPAMPR